MHKFTPLFAAAAVCAVSVSLAGRAEAGALAGAEGVRAAADGISVVEKLFAVPASCTRAPGRSTDVRAVSTGAAMTHRRPPPARVRISTAGARVAIASASARPATPHQASRGAGPASATTGATATDGAGVSTSKASKQFSSWPGRERCDPGHPFHAGLSGHHAIFSSCRFSDPVFASHSATAGMTKNAAPDILRARRRKCNEHAHAGRPHPRHRRPS